MTTSDRIEQLENTLRRIALIVDEIASEEDEDVVMWARRQVRDVVHKLVEEALKGDTDELYN